MTQHNNKVDVFLVRFLLHHQLLRGIETGAGEEHVDVRILNALILSSYTVEILLSSEVSGFEDFGYWRRNTPCTHLRRFILIMMKLFRSKIGFYLSLSYLSLCLLTLFALLISKPDSMSILALLFFTSPWSFLLLESVPDNIATSGGPTAFVFILSFSALLNASIFYLLGILLSKLVPYFK